ncbi:MAG: fibrobacter succinogenes major paralogous domain-containing protein [Fibromonadaceae bacterium]|jgi:uncharacterized protein (TIGR02145 family)|nr:fibrobacter succinogenes major paralogous domain-containing protein [Fibromonadaceae bacterium]
MRKKLTEITLVAGIMLALAFAFSCSSDDDGSGGNKITNYKTKLIGDQVWMLENLNYKVAGSVCYDNDSDNCKKYGRLYNWTTAMALPDNCKNIRCDSLISAKHKGICPSGWHIPNDDEWNTFIDFIGDPATAGTELKSANGWNSKGNGKDTYEFSALPGGSGDSEGNFNDIGGYGYWWSASEISDYGANYLHIDYDGEGVYWINDHKSNLFSIRCLQD